MIKKQYSCKKLCFPLTSEEIETSILRETNPKSLLFVCMDLETVSICIKKNLNFLESKDLISIKEFNSFSVNETLLEWRNNISKKESDILETDYKYIFNYHISHVIRAIKLSNLLVKAISCKIDYQKVHFYDNSWPLSYSRSNISLLIRQLMVILIKQNNLSIFSRARLLIKSFFWKKIYTQAKMLVLSEFFLRSLYRVIIRKKINLKKNDKIKRILFFSGGRDLRFHSQLSFYLESYSLISLKGKSIWNDKKEPNNKFDLCSEFFPYLWKGYFWNSRVVDKSFQYQDFKTLLKSISYGKEKLLDNYISLLGKYIGLKVERDIMIIKSCCGIIDKINPDLVFASSLPIPLISAKICNKVTISEFEGIGVEMNPMAPYIGDYISSPGPLSSKQIAAYYGGSGEILSVGAYYY